LGFCIFVIQFAKQMLKGDSLEVLKSILIKSDVVSVSLSKDFVQEEVVSWEKTHK
jgi:hypothetical protein